MSVTKYKSHVILLHGIGRSSKVMTKMAAHLALEGYQPHNLDYPSRTARAEVLATDIYQQVQPLLMQSERDVHFVGHSLGALLIRYILQSFAVKRLGRVVMIAPPNHGSEVAESLKRYSFYRKLFGPAGLQLGTDENQFLHSLQNPDYEVGIIAGDRSIDLLFSWFLLSGPNDGKVTVESTRLTGMQDHIVLHATHPFIASHPQAIAQTIAFLAQGKFAYK